MTTPAMPRRTPLGIVAKAARPLHGDQVASPRPKRERKVVLLVEDNEDALAIYGASLRHAGYEVIEAETIAEAREAASQRRPDAVVLDCRLPDGDGLELLASWRREAMMQEVPVLVVTASRERQDVEAAVLAGADKFVPKPRPGNVLAKYVENALQNVRSSSMMRRR